MRIPISWLHTQAYCEYQLKLRYLDKKQAEPSVALVQGIKGHDRLDREFLKTSEPLPVPIGEYLTGLAAGIREPVTMRMVNVESKSLGIIGQIDEAWLGKDAVAIIDDKPGETPWMSNKKQVWAYCLAFKEQYGWQGRMVAVLRNRDTQKVFWEKEFTPEDEECARESIQRIHGLFGGTVEWLPTTKPNKCKSCGYNKVCDRCLA